MELHYQQLRPSWDQVRMNMCAVLAARSTCWKKKTAAIIVCDNRIISEGFNGTPAGEPHCDEVGPRDRQAHRDWSNNHEIHAEINAIMAAAAHRGVPPNSTMYTILSPCIKCAQAVVSVKISRVVYLDIYRQDGLDYLQKRGIEICQFVGE